MLPPEHDYERHYCLKSGDTYVEAGAYYGAYGQIASRKVGPHGKVILIEPHPDHFRHIKSLALPNAIMIPKAVWSSSGHAKLNLKYGPLGYRIEDPGPRDPWIQVEIDTLDNILEDLKLDHVNLLAADVEGAEVEMLKGARNLLSSHRILNLAVMTYHKPENPSTCGEILIGHGYTVTMENFGGLYACLP